MQQAGSATRSGKPEMIGSDSEAWARLRLVQGRSSAELWELVSARGHTMLTVGSGTGCSWSIQEHGVAPIHFSLHWDGANLRIADTHGAGNLNVDGVPVTNDWRMLSGRARIDFGSAAIVVETSAGVVADQAHPLDRGTLPPPSPEARRTSTNPPTRSDVAAKPSPKATLLGVAPLTGKGAPIMASVPGKVPTPAPPALESGPAPAQGVSVDQTDSFRPKRPSDNVRAPKPTLMGMVQVTPTPAPQGPAPTPSSARPAAPNMNQTLLGVGDAAGTYGAAARVSRPPTPGASLADDDQRTIQGFPSAGTTQPVITVSVGGSASSVPPGPGRRDTQRGVVSVQPGVVPGAVTQARVRPISDPVMPAAPDPARQRPAQEVSAPEVLQAHAVPHESIPSPVPQAVMVGANGTGAYAPPYADAAERLSDAPTEMRDMASLDSRRPRRPFPWRYVGLGALTVVAYVAWLYLLDHF